ncbi:MAG TPA: DUF2721 domain-containing protein [Acidobacteriota bacterium]|jgi:hypothetical protein|nr:DUF2721 domain-containing protein [Acidobacteriota bacterium]HNT17697.1 DUF2721 domain-containing protein [Acidobacteriota bacterium]HPA27158.1 DUF2721 domain-containing protein [Acidobacteriota bacterium]HQO20159.1 DUF2721 domain-containing protein [Acidobacteriota bacterium]HQQ47161.1 DUF2721 domain-containing protein [Acidobacteriota bacterium]
MDTLLLKDLIPILQTAVGPVILISGIGLLILSMTNRYTRIFERTHHIVTKLPAATAEERKNLIAQLRVILKQAYVVRAALALAVLSVFWTAVLIISLFISVVFQLGFPIWIATLFILTLSCLIGSLIMFIVDINMSLSSLKIEVGLHREKEEEK